MHPSQRFSASALTSSHIWTLTSSDRAAAYGISYASGSFTPPRFVLSLMKMKIVQRTKRKQSALTSFLC